MLPDAAAELADAQRGVLARAQLAAMCGAHVADDLLRSGRFAPVDPPVRGVHRVRGGGGGPEQHAFAAALRARPGATITGPLVLGLLGVPGFGMDAPFEILTRPGRCLTNVPFSHRVDPDPDRAVTTYGEVRVVDPAAALIDAAARVEAVGERRLRVAWDHLRWERILTTRRMARRLDELRGTAPGVDVLERILEPGGGVAVESEGERSLAPFLNCFDPRPEPQVRVTRFRRSDFYFRPLRLAYEYLGAVDHDTVEQRLADDRRDDELRRAGIRAQYVVARDLDDPAAFLGAVAGTLAVRAHELGLTPPIQVRPLP